MKNKTYLFQITIPSVQKFISSSRKSSDLWAGSFMISYLMKELLNKVIDRYNCKSKDEFNCRRKKLKLIYPFTENKFNEKELIANIPNVAIFTINRIDENQAENLKEDLHKKFEELLNDITKFGIDKLFQEKLIFNDERKNETLEIEISCLFDNKEKEEYINLAKYQIKETLKLFIEYLEIDKDYKEISEDLANLINYQKKSQLPDREYIENYKLIKPFDWKYIRGWNNFYGFEKNNKFKTGTIKGVYRCSSCGEHTIIGANLEDWKGNTIWQPLWDTNPKIFNRGERLCGVCLAKRYFREYIQEKYKIKGKDLGFPSTSEIGATLFKKEILGIIKNKKRDELDKFSLDLGEFFSLDNVKGNYVKKLSEELKDINLELKSFAKGLLETDGEWFLEDTWKNENDYKMIGADSKKANQILKILKEIYKYLENKGVKKHFKPSEYYAVIMLDGDSIGEKLDKIKEIDKHRNFSKKLSELSKEFKNIVEENYGALIYSGGDDVLALVPVENALDCANEIQNKFKTTLKKDFPKIDKESPFSMSGAIIYAHHKLPLSFVLNEARKCEVKAKDEGKNRVCLKYIKRSLSSAEVVLKWKYIEDINIEEMNKLPNTFTYQLENFYKRLENIDKDLNLSIYTYFLKKKIKKELINLFLENRLLTENPKKIPDILQILKFMEEN